MKNLVLTLMLALVLALTGCSAKQTTQKSNLTFGNIKKNIQKGKSNQADVVQLLGSPNIVTRNNAGNEVWTYTRQSYDSESGAFGGGLLLFGGNKAFSSSSSNSFDLILVFDQSEVVHEYSVVSSQF